MQKTLCLAVVMPALILGAAQIGSAQRARKCSTNVSVEDQTGAVIPGAIVLKTDTPIAAVTDKDGQTQIYVCQPSTLSAQAAGFKSTSVAMDSPAPARIALNLKVADPGSGFPVVPTSELEPEHLQAASQLSGSGQTATVPPAGTTLALIGLASQSVITGDTIKAMPHQTITVENGHTNAMETYSGVPLAALLETVGAPTGKDVHGKALSEYVVATGSDGYKAVLALAEAEPDFHPGKVLVADELAGKPLDTKEGPFKLVVSEDKHPARSVHNLVKLELKQAE